MTLVPSGKEKRMPGSHYHQQHHPRRPSSLNNNPLGNRVSQDETSQPSSSYGTAGASPSPSTSATVKHIRLPPPLMQMLSPLSTDLILLLYGSVALGLQLLNLYKAVWWLPQSFNNSAMHTHLIKPALIYMVFILLSIRLPYHLMAKVTTSSYVLLATRYALFLLLIGSLTALSYQLKEYFGLVHVLYLIGPILMLILLPQQESSPLLLMSFFTPAYSGPSPSSVTGSQHHICTTSPVTIRAECEMLRLHFNHKLQHVLLLSLYTAYCSCFLPWCFVQPFVHYDLFFVTQHFVLVWMFSFSLVASRVLNVQFTDGLHKVALHLGSWQKIRSSGGTHQGQFQGFVGVPTWSPTDQYPGQSLCRHNHTLYKCSKTTCIEPGNVSQHRFQTLFHGSTWPRMLLGYHLSIELLAFLLLLKSKEWYQHISLTSLFVVSTHTLIQLGRDFLVVCKLYQAEDIIVNR